MQEYSSNLLDEIADVDSSWADLLKQNLFANPQKKAALNQLEKNLLAEEQAYNVIPAKDKRFNAFKLTSFAEVKVILLGQDPYPSKNDAMGLSFSVARDCKIPKSLKNIFIELADDLKIHNTNGDLVSWAKQGVLLLNSTLTLVEAKSNSHSKLGWDIITDEVLMILSEKKTNLVFILLGQFAISKQNLIDAKKHLILTSVHPSPLSAYRGFFGSKIFSKTNNYLLETKQNIIDWQNQNIIMLKTLYFDF